MATTSGQCSIVDVFAVVTYSTFYPVSCCGCHGCHRRWSFLLPSFPILWYGFTRSNFSILCGCHCEAAFERDAIQCLVKVNSTNSAMEGRIYHTKTERRKLNNACEGAAQCMHRKRVWKLALPDFLHPSVEIITDCRVNSRLCKQGSIMPQ